MKRFLCIFGIHNLIPIKTYNYIDTSWDYTVPSCSVTLTCKTCGKIKNKNFYGSGSLYIKDDHLTGEDE